MEIGTNDKYDLLLCKIFAYNLPDEMTLEGLKILNTLLLNITKNPSEKKFQSLKLSNEKLQNFVFSLCGIFEFFYELEFFEENNCLVINLNDENYSNIRRAQKILENKLSNFKVLTISNDEVAKIVNEKKKKMEEDRIYKENLLRDFNANRKDVLETKKMEIEKLRVQQEKSAEIKKSTSKKYYNNYKN